MVKRPFRLLSMGTESNGPIVRARPEIVQVTQSLVRHFYDDAELLELIELNLL